jgi:outer membrane protein TolC
MKELTIRSHRRFSQAALALTALTFGALDAQVPVPDGATVENMTMTQAVALALANNHDIAVQDLEKLIESERVNTARAAFDPRLEGSYAYQFINTPQNAQDFVATGGSALGPSSKGSGLIDPTSEAAQRIRDAQTLRTPNIFEQRNHVAKLSFVETLPTGTIFDLGSSLRILDNTLNRSQPPGIFHPEYETFTGLTVTQPLLRGFGLKANLAELRIAKSNVRLADLEWRSRTAAVVGNVVKLYCDVVFTYENMLVQREGIALAQRLFEDNKKRNKEGVLPPNEVLVAEGAVYTRREEALLAESQYVERQNSLQLLFKKGADAGSNVRIRAVDHLRESTETVSREALLEMAQRSRYDVLQAFELTGQRREQTLLARNQALPRLDLIASGGYHGLAGSTGSSYDDAAEGRGAEWTAGVTLSMPLEFRRSWAQARLAALQETQAAINVDRLKAQVSLEIDTVLNRIAMDRQRLETGRKSREVARQTMENEVKRLTEGVSTSYQVSQYQKEYSQARSRELAALADLNKDQFDLWLVTGQLLERRGIIIGSDPADKIREPKKD